VAVCKPALKTALNFNLLPLTLICREYYKTSLRYIHQIFYCSFFFTLLLLYYLFYIYVIFWRLGYVLFVTIITAAWCSYILSRSLHMDFEHSYSFYSLYKWLCICLYTSSLALVLCMTWDFVFTVKWNSHKSQPNPLFLKTWTAINCKILLLGIVY